MNPIDRTFAQLKSAGKKAFMPFITAGDPDLAFTGNLLKPLADAGADLIEIGFPFSDPIADGPTIQASYTRALTGGFRVDDLLKTVRQAHDRHSNLPPLVGMVSYSIIHRKEPRAFLKACQKAGFSGLIVPDLPVEETAELQSYANAIDLKLILLITPTTTDERIRTIAATASGFIYCVSLVGITGERAVLPTSVATYLQKLRQFTTLPLCLGFGVSTKEHVAMLRDHVDGVIVGSALVRLFHANANAEQIAQHARELASGLGK
jgi:tryptophan synthase alpha chain